MTHFHARTHTEADRITVWFAGDCDLDSRDRLTEVLMDAVCRAPAVFVDMSAVSFLDSTGVHALVTAHHTATERGGGLYVVSAGDPAAVVLGMTGLDVMLRAPDADERRHG